MKRHEEADSGLRKGFVHEDEIKQLQKSAPPIHNAPVAPPDESVGKESQNTPAPEKKATESVPFSETLKGPKVSVQGVSGKMITGVIRPIKVIKKEEPAEKPSVKDNTAQPVADAPVEKSTPATPVADRAEVPAAQPKTAAQDTVTPEKTVAAVEKKTPGPVQPPVKKVEPPKAPSTPPAKSPVKIAPTPSTSAKPADDKAVPAAVEKPEKTQAATPAPAAKVTQEAKKPAAPVADVNVPSKESKARSTKPMAAKEPTLQPTLDQAKPLKVKYDQGVVHSALDRMEKAGKTPIRPQRGSYVGKGSSTPAFKEQRSSRRSNYNKRNSVPQRENFFDKDKDEDEEKNRFSHARKPKKKSPAETTAMFDGQKDQSRRNFNEHKKHNRRNRRGAESWHSQEEIEFSEEALRRAKRRKDRNKLQPTAREPQMTEVTLPSALTVKELAEILKKTSAEVIKKLIAFGVMATVNQEIDFDTAAIIAGEFGISAKQKVEVTEEDILFDESEDKEEDLKARPPVVTVMGHVDHGKTSIMDWIRQAHVASGEAGGITQHIGAYMVDIQGKKITFLDTPGHEAFTAIRARGAQVTDIVVLVVAADDGVMPQTIEAIDHAKAAKTEIIVAINKIDKADADPDRVKRELAEYGLMDADWGGDTTIVEVSAKTGKNMQDLLDMIVLTGQLMELKANPDRQAKGTVIEASLDPFRGALATLLVQRGTLHQGDAVVVGTLMGNIRAMFDFQGNEIQVAGPSVPVEILGLPDVPKAGDIFYEVENEKAARSLVDRRQQEEREEELARTNKLSLENLYDKMSKGETKDLNIIIKGDVQGSIQALSASLEKLSNDEVQVHIIHQAVGAVTASDVRLADVSNAIIIGFNVRPPSNVFDLAGESGVEIRLYRVIYEAIEDLQNAMKGMLEPVYKEEVLGVVEVRETYKISGVGTVCGCYVTEGLIRRNAAVRVVRDGIIIHEGKLDSLRRFKDDVREVKQGYECGVGIENYNDIKVGDHIECFHMVEVERK